MHREQTTLCARPNRLVAVSEWLSSMQFFVGSRAASDSITFAQCDTATNFYWELSRIINCFLKSFIYTNKNSVIFK